MATTLCGLHTTLRGDGVEGKANGKTIAIYAVLTVLESGKSNGGDAVMPIIGYMIGTYILFRMVEIMFLSHSRYLTYKAHGWVIVFAVFTFILVGLMMLALAVSGITNLPTGN